MFSTNAELMAQARAACKGNWGTILGITIVYMVISLLAGAIPYLGWVVGILICGPLMVGYYTFFLALIREQEIKVNQLFEGFSCFINAFVAWLLVLVFTLLWALLLIVPGIIAAISYSMTFFILADNPTMDAAKAIQKSKNMMMGNKKRFFYLCCRYIGWIILGILSFGIGFLWIGPYMMTSFALFYKELSDPAKM